MALVCHIRDIKVAVGKVHIGNMGQLLGGELANRLPVGVQKVILEFGKVCHHRLLQICNEVVYLRVSRNTLWRNASTRISANGNMGAVGWNIVGIQSRVHIPHTCFSQTSVKVGVGGGRCGLQERQLGGLAAWHNNIQPLLAVWHLRNHKLP